MNKRQNAAKEQRKTMNRAGAMLTDMQASTVSGLYEGMKYTEELIAAGTRINWKGELKRAAVDLWDRKENDPDNAPGLWEDIMYKNGIRIIPETITPGLAFAFDELGWWKDEVYRSKLKANVYTPEQYPAGWEIVLEEDERTSSGLLEGEG